MLFGPRFQRRFDLVSARRVSKLTEKREAIAKGELPAESLLHSLRADGGKDPLGVLDNTAVASAMVAME